MPRYAIVEAPSALGHVLEHLGVERAPEVLLGAGLADGLAARWAGRVEAAGYSAEHYSETQIMNPQAIRDYSPLLAGAVTAVLDTGDFPVVLEGDCSSLLGTMLALRRRGRYGVAATECSTSTVRPNLQPCRATRSAGGLCHPRAMVPVPSWQQNLACAKEVADAGQFRGCLAGYRVAAEGGNVLAGEFPDRTVQVIEPWRLVQMFSAGQLKPAERPPFAFAAGHDRERPAHPAAVPSRSPVPASRRVSEYR